MFKFQMTACITHHIQTHIFSHSHSAISATVLHIHSLELSLIISSIRCFMSPDHCLCNSDAGAAGQVNTTPH